MLPWCFTLSCCDSLPVLPTTAIFFTLFSHFFSNCSTYSAQSRQQGGDQRVRWCARTPCSAAVVLLCGEASDASDLLC